MNTLVIDSSVQVKWLNQKDEDNIEIANRILQDALDNKVHLISPELAKYEVGNTLLKRKQLTPSEAKISLATLYSLPITFITESEDLFHQTFSIAYDFNITYYDASFLSLAKQYDATLVTDNVKHQGKSSGIKTIPLKDY